ncbi:unnamed protein product [Cyprideis torosa]|uniref:Uncharacterized protein n=1 Tax=Cyprideis torosa TaxID=163714 RepID=A0A7R8WGT8_9CRUS|nr:unnamed protein product [Cyprideis torosa]CAG0892452.1 unnamed protein product [Cyprideis torosa]
MALLLRSSRNILGKPSLTTWSTDLSRVAASSTRPYNGIAFEQRNKKLGRPMSPHLTIYAPQLTSMLSICHRGTGAGYAALLNGAAALYLFLPQNYTYYLNLLAELQIPPVIGIMAKFTLLFPLVYHMCNGLRHLMWDIGKGLGIKELYRTGYLVVAVSYLVSTAMISMALLLRSSRNILGKPSLTTWSTDLSRVAASSTRPYNGIAFEQRNKKLGRPMSPHLTIYAPQLTSMLSICHRGTGAGYAALLNGAAALYLFLPQNYTYYLNLLAELQIPPVIGIMAKFTLLFPLVYHMCNGLRHLMWDIGKGLGIKELYRTGYLVVAVSYLVSTAMVFLWK